MPSRSLRAPPAAVARRPDVQLTPSAGRHYICVTVRACMVLCVLRSDPHQVRVGKAWPAARQPSGDGDAGGLSIVRALASLTSSRLATWLARRRRLLALVLASIDVSPHVLRPIRPGRPLHDATVVPCVHISWQHSRHRPATDRRRTCDLREIRRRHSAGEGRKCAAMFYLPGRRPATRGGARRRSTSTTYPASGRRVETITLAFGEALASIGAARGRRRSS